MILWIYKNFFVPISCENLSNSSFHEMSWNLDPFFGTSNVLNFLKTFGFIDKKMGKFV